ncbi:MAG: EVE domain-containing protein [Alphaproteobacteria bacterium]|nr:EVE domain-containing protein [Alphaproteobacteria bacterium]
MAYWLVKSEPDVWSWDQQSAKGADGEAWTGVRNHQAKLYLMAMKKGEKAFYYHSNKDKAIVGIVEIIRAAYPDPTADSGSPWVCVDVKAKAPFKTPVALDDVKKEPALAQMVLVKNSRLSVQPVTDAEWARVCAMGGVKG